MGQPPEYLEGLTDSRRWAGFEFRAGDIVISVPSKCGTTWLQMVCGLLIFGSRLPEPLTTLSPWLDMRLRPVSEVYHQLHTQRHRRFIKTHTPLDGLPERDDVTYLVMGRNPRDVAISMSHHRANLDTDLIAHRSATAGGAQGTQQDRSTPIGIHDQVMAWIEDDRPVETALSTLKGMLWHLDQAYRRRGHGNVVLLHYDELSSDLHGEMRRLAGRLGIEIAPRAWPELVRRAEFGSMRADATAVVPDEGIGLLKDAGRFFRNGRSGQWLDLLDERDLRRYETRIAGLAEPATISWLHQGPL
jgi:hypothetical protein